VTIETDIIAWALERPAWQQKVLVRLSDGDVFDAAAIGELTDSLLDQSSLASSQDANAISLKSDALQQVYLVEIAEQAGVNALVDGQ
jgi:hypothetical protein